jgi:hypothetical protein
MFYERSKSLLLSPIHMENTKMIQILCENAKVWHKNDHPILYFLPSPIHPAFCYQGCLVKDHLI